MENYHKYINKNNYDVNDETEYKKEHKKYDDVFYNEDYKTKNNQKIIIKLKSMIKIIENKDPITLENDYFKKYGCETEIEKIELTANYLKHNLMILSLYVNDIKLSEQINHNLITIESILFLVSEKDLSNSVIKLMKRTLLKIALTFDMSANFYSEVVDLYVDLSQRYKGRTRGLNK